MRFRLLPLVLLPVLISAQSKIGTGVAKELYQQNCMGCHGEGLKGGLGRSLLDMGEWQDIGAELSFLEYTKNGNLEKGMPGFGAALTDSEIRSIEIYMIEMRQKAEREGGEPLVPVDDGVYSAGGYKFKVEGVVRGLDFPWSIAFLPEGGFLVTEREGNLWHCTFAGEKTAVTGLPKVWRKGQGGLLEVALHPEFVDNGWVYLAYTDNSKEKEKAGMTKIVRGRIQDGSWVDESLIFETPSEFHRRASAHFGTRLVFKDGYLFFSIGDRGAMDQAQDGSRPDGKIHRIHDDGRVPVDNPFVSDPDVYPTIWTLGHRNPQGLDMHPETRDIYESEHGPRGGDEINLIEGGKNYGWPVITYGMNYNGKPITDKTAAPGMEQPLHYWTPSIGVCGIDFYEGDAFPEWKYNLFAGGIATRELHRLVIEDQQVVETEIILENQGRVRDVASGPDGFLYLVLNSPHRIVRLVPAE